MRDINSGLLKSITVRDTVQIKQLLDAGADPNSAEEGEQGITALMLSVNTNQSDVVQMLLEHGADPNQHAAGQWTPLIEAAYQQFPGIVRLLLQHGADPHVKDLNGATALSQANDEAICGLLITYGAV